MVGGFDVHELVVHYQGTPQQALRGVTLRVPAGTGLVVTGPEGCGRTTLTRALVGLVVPVGGSVRTLGLPPGDPALRTRVGYCPEGSPFPPGLRAGDAVRLAAAARGADAASGEEALQRTGFTLGDAVRVERLEQEDVRRLALACAIVGDPEALVLDDPWEFPETRTVLSQALARGATVLVATPDPGGFPALLGGLVTLDAGVLV